MSINVANNNPHVVYTVAEGATQTTFSITFEFFDDDEVQLYVDGIIKTQGSGDGNYTITGGEGSTGTATFNTVSSGIQPVTGITGGSQVVITRNIPIERVTDFSAGSDINRAALNTQLDTLTAIAADNKMRSVRALTAPITDPTDVGTSLVIPKAADRANGFLSFDSNGNAAINSVVDLSFLTLERLDIDNVRIDGNTLSSTTGSLILAPTADVEINIPASSSLYMQRAGTTALDFAFTSISQEVRFINTTTATTYSVIQSNHLGGTSSDLILKSDGGPLELDTGGGTIPLKDDGVQRGYLNINTANTIKLYTGTGTGTLNTTFDGADVTIAGELVVSGNLTVDGTTTTINSTTLTVDDKNIVVASGAANAAAANGAGLTIDGAGITFTYDDTDGRMELNKELFVYGNSVNGESSFVSISSSDTGGDDVRIQGPNPNFSLYDSTAVADGVAAYTGGVNFYGQKTNTAYHTYSTIRPRIINGLDSDTARTGALHFGVSDGANAATTNIIFKIEPTGADVTGNITVSGTVDGRDLQTDGTKLDGIEANADVTDATNVAAAGAAMTSGADFIGDITVKTSDGAELKLQTSDTTVGINDVLGKLSFNAPNEASGTDAILEAASIKAVAASTFTSSSNATRLQFSTGNSEAAQIRMTIAPEGTVSVGSISTENHESLYTAMSVGRGTETYNILAINHSGASDNVGQLSFIGNTAANSAKIVHAPSVDMIQFYIGDPTSALSRKFNIHRNGSLSSAVGFGVNSSGVIDGHGLTLGDNHKAIFGAGSDLQIYHDAANSFIEESGTGNLIVAGSTEVKIRNTTGGANLAVFKSGAVDLYASGIKRLETTSTGVDITGGVSIDDDNNFSFGDGTTYIQGSGAADRLKFITNSSEAMRIDSSGNVGIGMSSPSNNHANANNLVVGNGTAGGIANYVGTGLGWYAFSRDNANNSDAYDGGISYDGSRNLMFHTNAGTERMRIDSSGRLLHGKTTAGDYVTGTEIQPSGAILSYRSGGVAAIHGRTDDGEIIRLTSNSSIVGSIASQSSGTQLSIETGSSKEIRVSASGALTLEADREGNGGGDTIDFRTAGSEAMRITSDGDLQLSGSTDNVIRSGSDSSRIRIFGGGTESVGNGAALTLHGVNHQNGNYADLASGVGGYINFRIGTSNAMRIDSSGNLLVGMTSDGYLAADDGIQIKPAGFIRIGGSGTSSRSVMSFVNDTGGTPAEVGTITTSGSSTAYNTSSDYRLKENVIELTGATDRLKQLQPKRFNFIKNANTTVDGFIAHEVQTVVPEAITGTHNEVDADGNPVYQGIDQSKLVPLLVATIKELEARITALEAN